MKSLLALLCMVLTVFITSSIRADSEIVDVFEPGSSDPTYRFLKSSWFFGDYDFDWIEEYIDEYYAGYYKTWERYLVSKQRELAGKFGLTNIIFKPDFREYADTKLVLSRALWNDLLTFRYIAPLGDIRNFDISIAFRPHRFISFIGRGSVNGDGSALVVISKPLGAGSSKSSHQKTGRLLKELGKLAKKY